MSGNFVLHWESVRPVPVITVDFGDGRSLVRTITGNSIHYILDSDGRPVDGLPGLFGAGEFQSWLKRSEAIARSVMADPSNRSSLLAEYHSERRLVLRQQLQRDMRLSGLLDDEPLARIDSENVADDGGPNNDSSQRVPAAIAARVAETKLKVERPMLSALHPESTPIAPVDDERWRRIARLYIESSKLDASSLSLVRAESPTANVAAEVAITKSVVEQPMLSRMVGKLESNIALDTVKNKYLLHRKIHEWFVAGEVSDDISKLNERVYSELFLTPSSDPWLGLHQPDVYTALTDAGIRSVD